MTSRRKSGLSPLLRKLLVWGLATLTCLILLGFISYARLLSYLQGEDFRDSLQTLLANKAQATHAAISGTLSIDENRVSLPGVSLQRPGLLQALSAGNIRAELDRRALLDKQLCLTRLLVEQGSVSLNMDKRGEKLPPVRKSSGGFFSRLAPTQLRLDRLDCKDFNAELILGGKRFSLSDSSLTANPQSGSGRKSAPLSRKLSAQPWEFRLSNGRLRTPLPILGDCSLKNAAFTLGGKVSTLSDARLMLSPGELVVNAMREEPSGKWSADLRANSVDIARFIPENWKKRVGGVLYGRLRADGKGGTLQEAEGQLSLQQAVLEALPFLSKLSFDNSAPYRHLKLEKATARLSYPHADAERNIRRAWLMDDIELCAEGGWLRVKGHVLVDADDSLSGTLLIGLPDAVATRLAPADSALMSRIFNASGDKGYQWLRLNLSGSLDAPQEDLSARLLTLLPAALPEAADALKGLLLPGAGSPSTPAEPQEKDSGAQPALPSPSRLLQDAGDAAGGLLNSGLNSLF